MGYFTLSKAGLILEANLTAAGMLGMDRSALPGKPLFRFILKDDQETFYVLTQNAEIIRRPQTCELRIMRKDGPPFWARLEAAASVDEGGAPGWRVVMSDISERRQVEQKVVGQPGLTAPAKSRLTTLCTESTSGVARPASNMYAVS